MNSTIEHEYQHFLNLAFLEPIEKQMLDKSLGSTNDVLAFQTRFGKKLNESRELEYQWEAMKDEIASYLERNGRLPQTIDSYLSTGSDGKVLKRFGENMDNVIIIDSILHVLLVLGIKKQEIVDIVRTSGGFEHVYNRLREKYKHIVNIPVNMDSWKVFMSSWGSGRNFTNIDAYLLRARLADPMWNFTGHPNLIEPIKASISKNE